MTRRRLVRDSKRRNKDRRTLRWLTRQFCRGLLSTIGQPRAWLSFDVPRPIVTWSLNAL